MTELVHPPVEDDASDDQTPAPTRVARIWKKRPPSEGSLGVSLKAMGILYDAGEPLTRQELETRLIPQLDPYERAYLEAWFRRYRDYQRNYRRSKKVTTTAQGIHEPDDSGSCIMQAVHAWITAVFSARTRGEGQRTVERMADGKLRPGTGTPVVLRMDGRRVPYTPETRQQLAQEDRDQHRLYLVELEMSELLQRLSLPDQAARAQLLYLLVRRLLIGFKTDGRKFPLDERIVSPQLNRLVSLADTPTLQKAILQRALDLLWNGETHDEPQEAPK